MCTVLLQLTVGVHLEQLAVGKYVVYVGWIDLCDLPVQSRCHTLEDLGFKRFLVFGLSLYSPGILCVVVYSSQAGTLIGSSIGLEARSSCPERSSKTLK